MARGADFDFSTIFPPIFIVYHVFTCLMLGRTDHTGKPRRGIQFSTAAARGMYPPIRLAPKCKCKRAPLNKEESSHIFEQNEFQVVSTRSHIFLKNVLYIFSLSKVGWVFIHFSSNFHFYSLLLRSSHLFNPKNPKI